MRPNQKRRLRSRRLPSRLPENTRQLRFQSLESRQLLAGDLGLEQPLADITGLWISVGNREYFTSEQASVTIDMTAGEQLQVTGVRYGLDETVTPDDGVIAFESYVRREHGAISVGSYDYTDGRFADPVDDALVGGETIMHPGFDSGWELDVIDNRITVVAIRYFGNEFVVEDRMLVDVNVIPHEETVQWTEAITPVRGEWESTDDQTEGDSRFGDNTVISVIETAQPTGERYEIGVKAKTVEENSYANGFVVVDYKSENDFVYAGLRSVADQWVIGHYDGQFNDLASIDQPVEAKQIYDLRVAVDGSHVALAADGVLRVTHHFNREFDGNIGLANQYAYTHFTDFHFFDNDPVEETPAATSDASEIEALELEVVESRAAVLETRQSSEASASQVAEAKDRLEETEAKASQLEKVHQDLQTQSEEAQSNLTLAEQSIETAQSRFTSASNSLSESQAWFEASDQLVEAATNVLRETEEALQDAREVVSRSEQPLAELQQITRDAAVKVAEASETFDVAAKAAKVARESSDAAQRLAESFERAPKIIRKALEAAAKEADKIADNAEKYADEAEKALNKLTGGLEDASKELDELAAKVADAEERFADMNERLKSVKNELDRLTSESNNQAREFEQAAETKQNAELELNQATQNADELSQVVRETKEQAEVAKKDSDFAREQATRAARELESTTDLARKDAAAHQAVLQSLAEMELALQTAIEAQISSQPDHIEPTGDNAIAYSLNFNSQDDGAFETVAGTSERVAGQLHLLPGEDNVAIAVLDNEALPERTSTRVYTTIHADALPGLYQNGFIVFDYQSPTDFKYAGAWAGADRWAIGEVIDGEFSDVEAIDEIIGEGPAYELQVWIENNSLTFLVEGVQKLQHTFDNAIDDGQIGVASNHARSRFDQVAVMQLHEGSGHIGIENAENTDAAIQELF